MGFLSLSTPEFIGPDRAILERVPAEALAASTGHARVEVAMDQGFPRTEAAAALLAGTSACGLRARSDAGEVCASSAGGSHTENLQWTESSYPTPPQPPIFRKGAQTRSAQAPKAWLREQRADRHP
jgi:hypothetical protein